MKVAFCSLPLSTGHNIRGIGAYTKNLLEALKKDPEIEVQEFSEISEIDNSDIAHYPFFDLFQRSLPLLKKFPTVVTIHDVTPLVFPEHYPSGLKGSVNLLRQKLALKNVKSIITDSESSKKDIVRYLSINSQDVHVIPLAASGEFKQIDNIKLLNEVSFKYLLPKKFVLYTGNINWNKNLMNLALACEDVGVNLVLVGSGFDQRENLDHPELKSFKVFLERFGKDPDKHVLGFVPTADLVAVMNLAQVVLLPSFYEGFGLPILEAQACGTPVITSNISSMPEVAGEGALFVNPSSVSSINKALVDVVKNKFLRENLVEKGFENIKKFSWEKTAKETIALYREISR
ncbi:glycosyltransferase family 1 protein [Candidatus Parcubacteria bacterium]|nr:MAG: glycosyltransferase family 1 protein [Candidatus Parcubacteria bacterium]